MNYSFSNLYQIIYNNYDKSFTDTVPKDLPEDKAREILLAKHKKRKEQIRSFFLDEKEGVFHNKPAELERLKKFLLSESQNPEVKPSVDYVRTVLFPESINVINAVEEKGSSSKTDAVIGELFDEMENEYGFFTPEEKANAKKDYLKLFRITNFVVNVLEPSKQSEPGDNANVVKLRAYKLQTVFGKKNQPSFGGIDTYFNKHVKSQKHERPLYKTLYKLKLPKRSKISKNEPVGTKINLEEWRKFILDHGDKALFYFHRAEQIQTYWSPPRAPKTIDEAEKACLYTHYRRATENEALGLLCVRSHLSEKSFNKCLDILITKARMEFEEKAPHINHLPDVLIKGFDIDLPGYYLAKLPSDDINAFVLGKLTNCCQHIGGNSEYCVMDGILRKNNGFYVLLQAKGVEVKDEKPPFVTTEHGKKINYDHYKIVGQGYAWLSSSGNLTFDSWENLTPKQCDPVAFRMLTEFSKTVCEAPESKMMRVTIGLGGKTPAEFKSKERTYSEYMQEGYNYGDTILQAEIYHNPKLKEENLAELKKFIPSYDDLSFYTKEEIKEMCLAKSDFVHIKNIAESYSSINISISIDFSIRLELAKLELIRNRPLMNKLSELNEEKQIRLISNLKSLKDDGANMEWVIDPILCHADKQNNYNYIKIFRALKKANIENDREIVRAVLTHVGFCFSLIKVMKECKGEEKYSEAVRNYYLTNPSKALEGCSALIAMREKPEFKSIYEHAELKAWMLLHSDDKDVGYEIRRLTMYIDECKSLGLTLPPPNAEYSFYDEVYASAVISKLTLCLFKQYDIQDITQRTIYPLDVDKIPEIIKLKKTVYYTHPAAARAIARGKTADFIINIFDTLHREKIENNSVIECCLLNDFEKSTKLIEIIKFFKSADDTFIRKYFYNDELMNRTVMKIKIAMDAGLSDEPMVQKLISSDAESLSYDARKKDSEFPFIIDALKQLKQADLLSDETVCSQVLKDARGVHIVGYIRAIHFWREQKLPADGEMKQGCLYSYNERLTKQIEVVSSVKHSHPDLDADFLKHIWQRFDESDDFIAAHLEMKKLDSTAWAVLKPIILMNPGQAKPIIEIFCATQVRSPEFRDEILNRLNRYNVTRILNAANLYLANIDSEEKDVQQAILRKPEEAKFFIDAFQQLREKNMLDADVREAIFNYEKKNDENDEREVLSALMRLKEDGLYDEVDIRAAVIEDPLNYSVDNYNDPWAPDYRFFSPPINCSENSSNSGVVPEVKGDRPNRKQSL